MFIRVLLPAPEGPMMAVICPLRNFPETLFKIVLKPRKCPSGTEYEISQNSMSTGGRCGRCDSDMVPFFWPLGLLLLF